MSQNYWFYSLIIVAAMNDGQHIYIFNPDIPLFHKRGWRHCSTNPYALVVPLMGMTQQGGAWPTLGRSIFFLPTQNIHSQ